jgi:ubiquinone/menaquinone biosynthesis C-methylase UbiE
MDFLNNKLTETDTLLNSWGYDLIDEYSRLINWVNFTSDVILDIATGTGRSVSVLSTFNSTVVTGDINPALKLESQNRIQTGNLRKVKYVQLDMEKLPFWNGALENIVCINTLHELNNPVKCLNEIVRISSDNAQLLIADFNELGFDIFDRVHLIRYAKPHRRGIISETGLSNFLMNSFYKVEKINTTLNTGFLATGKKT